MHSPSIQFTLTTQTRLDLAEDVAQQLDKLGDYHGRMLRKMYAHVASHGGKVIEHKTALCQKLGLSSRFFNALRVELQGAIDSVRELLKPREKELKRQIKALEAKLARFKGKFDEISKGLLQLSKLRFQGWVRQRDKTYQKLQRSKQRLFDVQARLAAPVPGIGFGSRKLFKAQYFLAENGYANHEQWLNDWRSARSHQAFFLGSSDETGGNQQCTLFTQPDGLFKLRVRIPDALIEPGQNQYLWLADLTFEFQEDELRAALARQRALTWRLHRDERGWRVFVAFARPAAEIVTLNACYGALGCDFNADHLSVTPVDVHGNLLPGHRVELPLEGLGTGQRKALLSDALSTVVEQAKANKLPLVIEDLNFEQKKLAMKDYTPARARALSGLAYSQYLQLIESKCLREGVELLKVNPAYTSLAGLVKYASKRGISVHQAAAGVVARRGQGRLERLPKGGTLRVPALGTTLHLPTPVRKEGKAQGVLWRELKNVLGKHLRDYWVTTRVSKLGVRKAGHAARMGSWRSPYRQAKTTVRSAKSTSVSMSAWMVLS